MTDGGARGDVNHIVVICEQHGLKKCGDDREGARTRTFTLSFEIKDERKARSFIDEHPNAPWCSEDGDDPKKIVRLQFSYVKKEGDEMGQQYENALKEVEQALGYTGPRYAIEERFQGQ